MLLFDLLRIWEPGFDEKLAKVHLARWNGTDEPLNIFVSGQFDTWQCEQNNRNFERPYVVSLIQAGSPTHWLFGGLFRRRGYEENKLGQRIYYDLERLPSADEWVGRLYLDSIYKQRNSYPNGETLKEDLKVVELRAERLSIGEFPGYKRVALTKNHLDIVVRSNAESWRAALSAVKGIYLISDMATGRLYVGKADGVEGIWGRWCSYAHTTHGDNVALKKEFGIDASPERRKDLKFSILEIADLHADDIDQRESHWKQVLHSRDYGYNRN